MAEPHGQLGNGHHPQACQGDTMEAAGRCVLWQVRRDDGRDSHGWQLLEGEAEGNRLHVRQVMHHQLATLCQHDDGHRVIVLVDRPLRRNQGESLDGTKPGQGVDVLMLLPVFLQDWAYCQAWLHGLGASASLDRMSGHYHRHLELPALTNFDGLPNQGKSTQKLCIRSQAYMAL